MKKKYFILLVLLVAGIFISEKSHASIVAPSGSAVILPGNPDPATVNSAVQEFKNLSKKEKKERIKEVKALIKHYKAEKKSGKAASDNTVLLCILAVLLPPLAVYLHEGEINNKFWISLLLTILFWLPGVIYALIVILGGD
ncbi:MAG: YqaE/Pmp3 family membrane protein [Bacteroidetes bacterium]|nr:YqaE/Pmp3 family membrane protein [Bacteroidota bacterium]MBS1931782.1 YqaE/Pmp3 family membrane protein [Bacteroidota bacterium]